MPTRPVKREPAPPKQLLTQSAYARSCGLSRQIVVRQIGRGLIPTHRRGKRQMIDPVEADTFRKQNLDPGNGGKRTGGHDTLRAEFSAPASVEGDGADRGFWAARTRKEVAHARRAELEVLVKESELVPLVKINAWIAGMVLRARNIFLRLGPELRDRLSQTTDPVLCEELIDKEVRRGLGEMAEYQVGPAPSPVPAPAGAQAGA